MCYSILLRKLSTRNYWKMADKVSAKVRSEIMSSIKSSGTKLENLLTHDLWKKGFRFRKNVKELIGKPDIAIKKYKIVVFIDSCFWHGCQKHCRMPSSNETYWSNKIRRNKLRDKNVNEYYKKIGWSILRIWEHDIIDDYDSSLQRIVEFMQKMMELKRN